MLSKLLYFFWAEKIPISKYWLDESKSSLFVNVLESGNVGLSKSAQDDRSFLLSLSLFLALSENLKFHMSTVSTIRRFIRINESDIFQQLMCMSDK